MNAVGLSWYLHALEVTDLDLHLAPVLVKLLLELSGLREVALQLTPGDDEPEGNEHNDAAQHDGVDQPCQHRVEESASIPDGSLIANAGNEATCRIIWLSLSKARGFHSPVQHCWYTFTALGGKSVLSNWCQCFQFIDWPTNTLSAAIQSLPAKAALIAQETRCAAKRSCLCTTVWCSMAKYPYVTNICRRSTMG